MSDDQLKEITPETFLCANGSCPSVFETEDGRLVVIGKIIDKTMQNRLPQGKVGEDEIAIEIPAGLIKDLR